MYTIDTSVWINAVEPHEPDHAASRQLLGLIRARQLRVIVPTLVTVEVAGTASRLRDPSRGERLARLLGRLRLVAFVSLDIALAHQAASLAAAHRLRRAVRSMPSSLSSLQPRSSHATENTSPVWLE